MIRDLVDTVDRRKEQVEGQEEKFRSLVELRASQLGFNEIDAQRANNSMDGILWKFMLAGVHLERLWQLRETVDLEVILDASLVHHRLTSSEELAAAIELEGFLFQSRAMLDFMMYHILAACGIGFSGKMGRKKFRSRVRQLEGPNRCKAQIAANYLDERVFAEDKWGGFLCSLRDRIAHQNRLRPGYESSEKLFEKTFDWPTIAKGTFHSRAQEFENGAWDMLTTVIPALWGRKWISGSYRSGMWDTV